MPEPLQNVYTSEAKRCGHCQTITILRIVGEGIDRRPFEWNEDRWQDPDEEPYPAEVWRHWSILLCPVCSQVNIWEDALDYDENEFWLIPDPTTGIERPAFWPQQEQRLLFPCALRKRFNELPDSVARSYEAALSVLKVQPTAFAVMAGRMLEFLCDDRHAVGKGLNERLNSLVKQGEIPAHLADLAHSLRFFRNLGAHADLELSQDDALALKEICDAVLEYVYEAPALLDRVQRRIDDINSQKKS